MRGLPLLAVLAAVLLGSVAPAADELAGERQRLAAAKRQSAAAAARSTALDRQASAEQDAAARARAQEAAVAARVQQAEADIAAAQARIAILERLTAGQQARLAAQQGPVVRLVGALQSLASRPTLLSLVQPGSIDDLVHVRAVLGSTLPVVAARTAGVRADLARARDLREGAVLAAQSLRDGRTRLETVRLELTRMEAEHRLRGGELGRGAMVESDRAIALGEQARDIVDLMQTIGNQAEVGAALATLPGPLPRPPRPGEAADAVDPAAAGPPAYRLPVTGAVLAGLGELSDAGVRSRGLTLAAAPDATAVAPAAGRVAYAARFRDYGTIVILDHGGGWTSLVSGLAEASVRVGDRVAQGDAIGRVGEATGGADRPRVTVELRRRGRPMDLAALL